METNWAEVTVSMVLPLTEPRVAVIMVVPRLAPVARPEALMPATAGMDDDQVTWEVRFLVLPSL